MQDSLAWHLRYCKALNVQEAVGPSRKVGVGIENCAARYDPDDLGYITFVSSKGTMQVKWEIKGETYFSGSRIQELHLGGPVLASYTGQFRSTELDTAYGLSLEKDSLTLRNRDNPPQKLTPIAKDEFDAGDFGRLVFERDSGGRVIGLSVFRERARGIAFKKED